jgi:hypothetical protein
MAKPDLKINIPGATAPELPYSQRSQTGAAADQSRLQKVSTPQFGWPAVLLQQKCTHSTRVPEQRILQTASCF